MFKSLSDLTLKVSLKLKFYEGKEMLIVVIQYLSPTCCLYNLTLLSDAIFGLKLLELFVE